MLRPEELESEASFAKAKIRQKVVDILVSSITTIIENGRKEYSENGYLKWKIPEWELLEIEKDYEECFDKIYKIAFQEVEFYLNINGWYIDENDDHIALVTPI